MPPELPYSLSQAVRQILLEARLQMLTVAWVALRETVLSLQQRRGD